MQRVLAVVGLCAVVAALSVGITWQWLKPSKAAIVYPSVIEKIREVSVLEALSVQLYKKIDFQPDPVEREGLWGNLSEWLRHTVRKPRGRAIVFGDARFVYDLRKLDAASMLQNEGRVWLVLPPSQLRVELDPGATEIIGSNLDSQETAQLLALAKDAMASELRVDQGLQAKARRSAETSLRELLLRVGFRSVDFVETLPAQGAPAL